MAAEDLDDTFCEIVRNVTRNVVERPTEDKQTVAGWLQEVGKEVQTDKNRCARNEYGRYLRYIVQSSGTAGTVDDECDESAAVRVRDLRDFPSTSKRRSPSICPRKHVIGHVPPKTDMEAIREVIEKVNDGEITTTPEYIFNLANCLSDRGNTFQEIMEKDFNFFREVVDETIDRRIQDEADVMMHTQNDIREKFQSLTDAMLQRTLRIRQRLHEISPKFDWISDGRNRAKLAKLINVKRKEMTGDPKKIDKLMHQIFMRGQWLKKEWMRLQEENANLQTFLDKFRVLAAERKAQESHVPRMLCKEKQGLEEELKRLQKSYKRNMEIIDALYVEHQRCVEPPPPLS